MQPNVTDEALAGPRALVMDLFKLIERSTSATAVIWMLPVGSTCTLSLVPVSQLALVRFSIKM